MVGSLELISFPELGSHVLMSSDRFRCRGSDRPLPDLRNVSKEGAVSMYFPEINYHRKMFERVVNLQLC